MKEAIVSKGTKVEIVDSPIPEPNDDQVLIKVVVSGSNPKDWKLAEMRPVSMNQGDDIAGIVEKVGANVYEFKPGDRVAAFHQMFTPHGSYAEYAIAWAHTTFPIPPETSFEDAATLPLAAMTAAVGLYQVLNLPQPWDPIPGAGPPPAAYPPPPVAPVLPEAHHDIPLVIYGASSAVGFFTLQLARRSHIHPIICVAGRAIAHVEPLLDRARGDAVVDYRAGDDSVVAGIEAALGGRELLHAFDAVSESGSPQNLGRVLSTGGKAKVAFVLGGKKEVPGWVQQQTTHVGSVHSHAKDFGFVYYRYFARGLKEGWFRAQNVEVRPGGLGGVQGALEDLKAGRASAVKYVFRIAETEGVES
ncbi:alcohol dehydrogenase-like protein [Lasiosphaeria hispida]|uniref:Alcohol dehydrogenase-like protein n=1 Tax=Lasiosphaeria hispida TaxID=260671 RepID=A0AAJ0MAS2_9PEZI|nr:alcohol dehydrogenase-like protein [Lasiosphaeria hispida]